MWGKKNFVFSSLFSFSLNPILGKWHLTNGNCTPPVGG
jgi:hypothetical protein